MSSGVLEVKSLPLRSQQKLYGPLKKRINWSLNGAFCRPSEKELILQCERGGDWLVVPHKGGQRALNCIPAYNTFWVWLCTACPNTSPSPTAAFSSHRLRHFFRRKSFPSNLSFALWCAAGWALQMCWCVIVQDTGAILQKSIPIIHGNSY